MFVILKSLWWRITLLSSSCILKSQSEKIKLICFRNLTRNTTQWWMVSPAQKHCNDGRCEGQQTWAAIFFNYWNEGQRGFFSPLQPNLLLPQAPGLSHTSQWRVGLSFPWVHYTTGQCSERQKTAFTLHYNANKGGVEKICCKKGKACWHLAIFHNITDISTLTVCLMLNLLHHEPKTREQAWWTEFHNFSETVLPTWSVVI